MVATPLTLSQLRRVIQNSLDELALWFTSKPRVFALPRPEQQLAFELASRLRETLRSLISSPSWDRLYYDASSLSPAYAMADSFGRRPPIYIDTRQLFGLPSRSSRGATAPDVAIALQVLRSAQEALDLDDNGHPRHPTWLPVSIREQGWMLDEHVRQLEQLSQSACECWLFVAYSNDARRKTAVDSRVVASWASWQKPTDTLWWAARHFRAKSR
jgi:hypothetical protein